VLGKRLVSSWIIHRLISDFKAELYQILYQTTGSCFEKMLKNFEAPVFQKSVKTSIFSWERNNREIQ
jgi:hypothetical protein